MKKTQILLTVFLSFIFVGCSSPVLNIAVENSANQSSANARAVTTTNGTMMQYFHWYYPADGSLWGKVQSEARNLADSGITALWLPPAYKGTGGGYDVGYGVYDMYDLGEFNQKGTVRTKYGDVNGYLAAVDAAQAAGMQVYGDVVFNHRGGAEGLEWVNVDRVDRNNRNWVTQSDHWIQAWTRFDFPGRNNAYSNFKWRWYHFDGVDWDQSAQESAIFRFRGNGKGWDWEVDTENSNYDYLMYADLDLDHPEVRQELKDWGNWYVQKTGVDGFRIDAVKHIKYDFFNEWLYDMRAKNGNLFAVGEFWSYEIGKLHNYLSKTNGSMSLFDAPLHMNFYQASRAGGSYDMRKIMDGTLMQEQPALAVTLVENHDTQPLQALESPVDHWFKKIAYAIILLRHEGYPNVFYPDYYGASYTDKGYNIYLAKVEELDELLALRQRYAYGTQHDYRDHWDIIGWTREGNSAHPGSGLAALVSDGPGGSKWMYVGRQHAGKVFTDYMGNNGAQVSINSDGWGQFWVNGGSVSVYVAKAPSDIRGHWAETEIAYMTTNGYMSGYPDGTFRPDNTLTRGEFATMIVAVINPPQKSAYASRDFSDIDGHWAHDNILKAALAGYLGGYPDGTFRPQNQITRQEVIVALANGMGLSGGSTYRLSSVLKDYNSIATWARQSLANAGAANLLISHPDPGYFRPTNRATRADVVASLYQVLSRSGRAPTFGNPYQIPY